MKSLVLVKVKFTLVILPADLEEFIKTTVASGTYASEIDVIRAAR